MFFDLSERLGRGNISWLVLIAEAEGSPWTLSGMPVLGEAEMECACSFTNTLTALVRLVGMPFTQKGTSNQELSEHKILISLFSIVCGSFIYMLFLVGGVGRGGCSTSQNGLRDFSFLARGSIQPSAVRAWSPNP